MTSDVRLLSLSTAVPPHELRSEDVIKEARALFAGRHKDFDRMAPVFTTSGIGCRYSVRPYSWFRADQGWPERTEAYVEGALDLFRKTAGAALRRAGVAAGGIDTIVTVSSTGIATPSLESRVMHEMGFRDDVHRVPVFGLGCAGGMSGLALAARLARGKPGAAILLVVIELCTLAFRSDELTKSNIIATALFGDGAAACVVSTKGPAGAPVIEHAGEHTWPGTRDVMGWRMDPQGFGAILSKSIPEVAQTMLRPVVESFLTRHGLTQDDIQAYSMHPGGGKVILALEHAFGLGQGALQHERDILARFGNMSAPTVLFVFNESLKAPFTGRRFLGAMGPGFTASFITLLQ